MLSPILAPSTRKRIGKKSHPATSCLFLGATVMINANFVVQVKVKATLPCKMQDETFVKSFRGHENLVKCRHGSICLFEN